MKNISKLPILLLLVAALCMVPQPAAAQTAVTTTTVSTLMTANQTTITLASGTNVNVQSAANQFNTGLYVDKEFMRVVALVSGTTYTVQRGQSGTRPHAHASGAVVYVGPIQNGPFFVGANVSGEAAGYCLTTNELYLPRVYVVSGNVYDCKRTGAAGTGGQWINISNGTLVPQGSRISAFCTGSLGSAETEYLNGAACSGATTATARQLITQAGTIANLYAVAGTAVSGGSSKDVMTVYKNGSATAVTCTFATGGAATTCSDTTHSVQVAAGDVITFQFVTATSDTGANVGAAVSLY